jgi:beta-lactamase class A
MNDSAPGSPDGFRASNRGVAIKLRPRLAGWLRRSGQQVIIVNLTMIRYRLGAARTRVVTLAAMALLPMAALAQSSFPTADVQPGIEAIAQEARGRVGVTAMIVETGQRLSFKGAERFPMQSVYKFPIAMAALADVDQGRLQLDENVPVSKSDLVPQRMFSRIRDEHPEGVEVTLRELLRYALVESDGTASDVLMRLAGGPARVESYVRELGIDGVAIATTEAAMARGREAQYRNWSTPDAMVDLLAAFQRGRGLSASSRTLMLQWMTEATTGPARIKGLLPPGTVVAHKTGTSGTEHGFTPATNDVGLITLTDGRHLAIAVFVSDSTADTPTREGVIAKISRAAWDWARAATDGQPRARQYPVVVRSRDRHRHRVT